MKIPNKYLDPELEAFFQSAEPLTPEEKDELIQAGQTLEQNPEFQADFLKSCFVEQILEAMEGQNLSHSELAELWGKSRQYVSRILNEGKQVNFTIETMVELADLLGHRLNLMLVDIRKYSQKPTSISLVAEDNH